MARARTHRVDRMTRIEQAKIKDHTQRPCSEIEDHAKKFHTLGDVVQVTPFALITLMMISSDRRSTNSKYLSIDFSRALTLMFGLALSLSNAASCDMAVEAQSGMAVEARSALWFELKRPQWNKESSDFLAKTMHSMQKSRTMQVQRPCIAIPCKDHASTASTKTMHSNTTQVQQETPKHERPCRKTMQPLQETPKQERPCRKTMQLLQETPKQHKFISICILKTNTQTKMVASHYICNIDL